MFLLRALQKFLNEYWDQKSPLLLGYSGGPDSKALLYLLLELGVRPHLAHVDHGWREESALEAEELKKEAQFLNLPFHTIRLDPDRRESVAREKRLDFFSSLFQKIPFQALLLAHQADDGAETVLKRVLEGAHLVYLGGMKPASTLHGLLIWRPLLSTPRREVLAYLEKKELSAIQDKTNADPSYLRARMRVDILPSLALSFGKGISGNLGLLGWRSLELQEYLDRKTDPFLAQLRKGPFGWVLPPGPSELLEMRHLLQRLGLSFSRFVLEGLSDALIRKQPNRVFGPRLIADRGYFFYLAKKMPCFAEPILLQEGVFYSGDWCIEISPIKRASSTWFDLFLGDVSFLVPMGTGQIQMSKNGLSSSVKRLYQQKIPAFLRPYVPHLFQQGVGALDLFSLKPFDGLSVRFFCDPTLFCSV
jgi:tRNA(Ile)-lysidine synthase